MGGHIGACTNPIGSESCSECGHKKVSPCWKWDQEGQGIKWVLTNAGSFSWLKDPDFEGNCISI